MLRIFDLQRYALHDGPGIRTTVFVKGCPLDCLWCHNPESKSPEPQLGCLFQSCVGCGACAGVCPSHVHSIRDGVHQVDFDRCVRCGACLAVCPAGALRLYGQERDCASLMEVIRRDRAYYARSGGGLTISGGEPMMQFEGTLELLKAAKAEGLHTCLDTCGFAPAARYEEIAPWVDLFLFDYKLTDSKAHQKYTGVPNELILDNLDRLCALGSRLYLRCPIIPGINDSEDHFQAIAALSRKYPEQILQVNVMAYHNMAAGKTAQIGRSYALRELESIDARGKQEIEQKLARLGCRGLAAS